mmetsp:Transcript_34733/g.103036  ORF Transcript_34733/g.103036 Transcript_34733/m.103036 type:complete len:669 (-) Transcript_34733:669-2675(-)
MPSIGHDTKYLQELVGDALARGTAATITAQPNDPVDFLGQWLLRYVKNAKEEADFVQGRAKDVQAKIEALEAEQRAADERKSAEAARRDAVEALAAMRAEPQALVAKALELIASNTSAGSAYAAAVADPEEPDWVPPEDPEDPAANESDDEPDPTPPDDAEGGGEGGDAPAAADDEAAGGDADAPAEGEDSGDVAAKVARPVDYSMKYLSYMAATSGQEFMKTMELRRPGPPPEDAPEDAPEDYEPEPMPYTFRILDERQPMLYCDNVAFEKAVKFLRDFPKIGSYQAVGVQAGGEFRAIVGVDTLFPEGNGQPLSQADQDFVWEVCLALGRAYEAQAAEYKALVEGKSAKQILADLDAQIMAIYNPPPSEPVEGEEGNAPATDGNAAEPEAAAEAPAEDEDAAAAEGGEEGGEEGGGTAPDPIAALTKEIERMRKEQAGNAAARTASEKAAGLASGALGAVVDTLRGVSGAALAALRNATSVPQGTFHTLKAVLHLLGKPQATMSNWKRAYEHLTPSLFNELAAYDAAQERDPEVWKRVRCAYKAAPDAAKLEAEMPDTHLGLLLLRYVRAVRKAGRKAAAFRANDKKFADVAEALAAKEAELAELVRVKAEEEEAARMAAEEAAEAERLAAEEAERNAAAGEDGGAEGEEGAAPAGGEETEPAADE